MDTKLQQLLEEAHGLVQRVEPKEIIPNIDDYFIIDVREPDEVAQSGKVKGALNIPRGVLEFRMKPDQEIKADQPILIYCGGGSRAALAGKTLLEIGFTNVQNLGGLKIGLKQEVKLTPLLRQLFDHHSSTYTYIIGINNSALIIDPVKENVPQYLQLLKELGLSLAMVLDTHVHADHITGSGVLQLETGCEVGSPKESAACCGSFVFEHKTELEISGLKFQCLFTPGHTNDSYCFYFENPGWVFTGDTLFIRGTGRTDFQNGSPDTLYESLHKTLLTLPLSTVVYPGHDYKGMTSSTIEEEKRNNPRLLITDKDDFIDHMNNLKLADPKMMDIAVPANLKLGL